MTVWLAEATDSRNRQQGQGEPSSLFRLSLSPMSLSLSLPLPISSLNSFVVAKGVLGWEKMGGEKKGVAGRGHGRGNRSTAKEPRSLFRLTLFPQVSFASLRSHCSTHLWSHKACWDISLQRKGVAGRGNISTAETGGSRALFPTARILRGSRGRDAESRMFPSTHQVQRLAPHPPIWRPP